MTLQEFTRDIVPILQLLIGLLGLTSLFLLWWQVRQTNLWHKINNPQNFSDPSTSMRLERSLYDSLKKIGIEPVYNRNQAITLADALRIIDDDEAYFATKAYLNELENLGAAISIGAADPDLTYAVHSTRMLRAHKIFSPFIDKLRVAQGEPEIYIEIEKTALAWQRKQFVQKEYQQVQLKELQTKLARKKGAKKKI